VRPLLSFQRRRPVRELLVVEGRDAGQQFTLDAREVRIGRGVPQPGCTDAVLLSDPTVSSQQALIRVARDGLVLEHRPSATNPTLKNGRPVTSERLELGDRIQVGLTVLELRERSGISLGDLPEALTESRANPLYQPESEATDLRAGAADATEARALGGPWGHLEVVRGVAGAEGRSFPLVRDKISIGRSPDADVVIPEQGVSRVHAELRRQGDEIILIHRSAVNPTYVDGVSLEGQQLLNGGEEIQLADRVLLRLALARGAQSDATQARPAPARRGVPTSGRAGADEAHPGLVSAVHEQIELQQRIEREFQFRGSFLDVDVVDSYGMKARAGRPDRIIVSFDRFREFARGVIEEFDGQFLNSNGDELMCFFDSPHQAVRAGSALLRRLGEFNEKQNLLDTPFRVRIGVHTGDALVDRRRGIAYSTALDVAGHLQKHAQVGGVLISEQTLAALPEGLPFEAAGMLEREGFRTFQLAGSID
jgi:pSer/pThr/pTyr-binding forkhead associated (FHA) protein